MADKKAPKQKIVYETKEELYQRALASMENDALIVKHAFRAANFRAVARMFHDLGDYEDSRQLEQKCLALAKEADQKEIEYQYARGVELRAEAGSAKGYEKAMKQFAQVPGYRDADAQKAECEKLFEKANHKNNRKKTIVLVILVAILGGVIWFFNSSTWDQLWRYIKTGSTTESSSGSKKGDSVSALSADSKIGDVVHFGNYDWYVLDQEDGSARLLLNHAEKHAELRDLPFNEEQKDVTWEDSTLRAWLNGAFLEDSFSEEERGLLLPDRAESNSENTTGTEAELPQDLVTLLTAEDITAHADIVKGIRMNIWLMDPGKNAGTAMFMSARNAVMDYGYEVSCTDFYTCPVIWVSTQP